MFVVVGAAPFVFLLAILDARLARSAVGDLLVECRSEPAPRPARAAVAALRDPRSASPVATAVRHVGRPGRATDHAAPARRRALRHPDRQRRRTSGGPCHDPSLDDEPQLLEAVGAAARIAIENERLQVELKAKLQELEGSRERVIEAGQHERKRLERNLHDGAQQRLVALCSTRDVRHKARRRSRCAVANPGCPRRDRDLARGAARRRPRPAPGRGHRPRARRRAASRSRRLRPSR